MYASKESFEGLSKKKKGEDSSDDSEGIREMKQSNKKAKATFNYLNTIEVRMDVEKAEQKKQASFVIQFSNFCIMLKLKFLRSFC